MQIYNWFVIIWGKQQAQQFKLNYSAKKKKQNIIWACSPKKKKKKPALI